MGNTQKQKKCEEFCDKYNINDLFMNARRTHSLIDLETRDLTVYLSFQITPESSNVVHAIYDPMTKKTKRSSLNLNIDHKEFQEFLGVCSFCDIKISSYGEGYYTLEKVFPLGSIGTL